MQTRKYYVTGKAGVNVRRVDSDGNQHDEFVCDARDHAIDSDDEVDELGLCNLCHEINQLAQDFGYDEIRRALPMLEELGSKESEQLGEASVA